MKAERRSRLVAIFLVAALVTSTLVATSTATPSPDLYATPEMVPPAILARPDVETCKGDGCNGVDPIDAGCTDEPGMTERQKEAIVEGGVATMHLVGTYPGNMCESVQWARADPNGPQDFALRVVQCETGLATEWAEFRDHSSAAWSPMISSPDLCAWAEYAVPDDAAEGGWRVIARTEPDEYAR